MPHTNAWSDVIPAGTELSRNIDDHLRRLRLDVHERMSDIVADWTADPVTLKDDLKGKVVGKQLLIPYTAFAGVASQDYYTTQTSSDPKLVAGLELPPGVTVTKIEYLVDTISTGGPETLAWSFYKVLFDATVAPTVIAGGVDAVLNKHIISSGVLAEVISGGSLYYLTLDTNSGTGFFHLFGVRITYDVPDSRYTV